VEEAVQTFTDGFNRAVKVGYPGRLHSDQRNIYVRFDLAQQVMGAAQPKFHHLQLDVKGVSSERRTRSVTYLLTEKSRQRVG